MYAGLTSLQGLQVGSCSLDRQIFCPFCMSSDAAILSSEVHFTARMSEHIVSEQEPLAAFVCPNSHFFLVRTRDVLPVGPSLKLDC